MWDGVYTSGAGGARQGAVRARPARDATTSSSPAPSADRRSRATRSGRSTKTSSLGSLFTLIRDTMPQDGPSLVSDEIKADILAYIMSVNGMPAGNDELKADLRALEEIKIAKKTTWDGVFTEAQAERGKQNFLTGRCGGCHKLDLTGDRGPDAQGRRFPGALGERQRRDAVRQDPRDDAAELAERDDRRRQDRHRRLPAAAERFPGRARRSCARMPTPSASSTWCGRARPATIPNFSLVQVVGCLTQGPNNAWTLTQHERAGADARRRADRRGAADGAGQGARRSDLSAGQRRAVQARRAHGPQDGSARPACTRIRPTPGST